MRLNCSKRIKRSFGRSLTRPNMALSVKEIQERFATGKTVPQSKTPIHEPDTSLGMNPLRKPYCDIVDVTHYAKSLDEALNKTQAVITHKQQSFMELLKKSQEPPKE